jgi:hypothetical protein
MTSSSTIVLHRATPADDDILRELSQLDSSRTVRRPALIAVIDGRSVAAASLSDGRLVADPFAESAEAVALLRVRRTGMEAGRARRAPRFPRLRPRPAI